MLKNLLLKLTAVLVLVSLSTAAFAQGTTCDMAEVVTPGDYMLTDTIVDGGNTQGDATGAAWYSYTPTESGILNINSCLGGGDTRLIMWTGACDALSNVGFNDDACDLAEGGPAYASSIEGFVVTAGTTYLLEWDNRWDDTAFSWNLSFMPLPAFDLSSAIAPVYLNVPETSQSPIALTAAVGNFGASPLTGVTMTSEIYDAADPATVIATVASDTIDLAGFQDVGALTSSWAATQGNYIVVSTITMNETEETPEDHSATRPVNVTANLYSADAANTGNVGLNGGEVLQAQLFTMYNDGDISSVAFEYTGGDEGDQIDFLIYNSIDGLPGDTLFMQPLDVAGGCANVAVDLAVPAGDYYIAINAITATANVGLGWSADYYYPGHSILEINQGGTYLELAPALGLTAATYSFRIITTADAVSTNLTVSVDMATETVSADGVHVVGTFNDWDPTATMMTDADGDGVYTATVAVSATGPNEYRFVNGNTLAASEVVPEDCGVDNAGTFNRSVEGCYGDATVAPVCFGLCINCPPPGFPECIYANEWVGDDLESYTAGAVSDQSPLWVPWPGGESANVSMDQAQSGTNSVHIIGGGNLDQVLLMPSNVTSGAYSVNWSMFIATDGGAYYNLQADGGNIGGEFKIEVNMIPGGVGSVNAGGAGAAAFNFPTGEWFNVAHCIDFDNDLATLTIAGQAVIEWPFSWQSGQEDGGTLSLGAVNFYPLDATYDYFIDDISVSTDVLPPYAECTYNDDLASDDLESYTEGAVSDQSPLWAPWPGGESAVVSTAQAQSGVNSVNIVGGGNIDQVLVLPNNITSGAFSANWSMFIPEGAGAYYNLQADGGDIGGEYKIEVNMAPGNVGNLSAGGVDAATFSFPTGQWFNVEHCIDLDNDMATLNIDGNGVISWPFSWQSGQTDGGTLSFGAVNYYPLNAGYNFFVDDVSVMTDLPVADLTVAVNTTDPALTVDAAGMFVAGTFTGWENLALTDNGDGTWSTTVSVTGNTTHFYKFKNGTDGWENNTDIGDCVSGDNSDRFVDVGTDAVDAGIFCFESCEAACPSGTIDLGFDAGISVSPNPSSGQFRLAYDLDNAANLNITVSNILGQVIATRSIDNAVSGAESFNLTNVAAGTYSIVITDGERLSTKRIVIK